jgi:hypothetical protein
VVGRAAAGVGKLGACRDGVASSWRRLSCSTQASVWGSLTGHRSWCAVHPSLERTGDLWTGVASRCGRPETPRGQSLRTTARAHLPGRQGHTRNGNGNRRSACPRRSAQATAGLNAPGTFPQERPKHRPMTSLRPSQATGFRSTAGIAVLFSGGGGIRTLGRPCGRQRFSRPRRNDRNAASPLEPAPRGTASQRLGPRGAPPHESFLFLFHRATCVPALLARRRVATSSPVLPSPLHPRSGLKLTARSMGGGTVPASRPSRFDEPRPCRGQVVERFGLFLARVGRWRLALRMLVWAKPNLGTLRAPERREHS